MEVLKIESSVVFDGKVVVPLEDGYLGNEIPGEAFIELWVPPTLQAERPVPNLNIHGLSVDGNKNIQILSAHTPPGQEYKGYKFYRKKIPILPETKGGGYYTHYPSNNIRLLEVDLQGNFSFREVALVCQGHELFVTVQKVYESRCYIESGILNCPDFPKWNSLPKVLVKFFPPGTTFPPLSEYRAREGMLVDTTTLTRNTAKVVRWNHASGVGVITATQNKVVRVHWNEVLTRRPRLRFLRPGEVVSYKYLRTPHFDPKHPTAFKYEAVGVKPFFK